MSFRGTQTCSPQHKQTRTTLSGKIFTEKIKNDSQISRETREPDSENGGNEGGLISQSHSTKTAKEPV